MSPTPTDTPVIELDGTSLCYRLAKQRIPSFKEYAIHWIRGTLHYEELWALRNVDLTVYRGETLGIVGRNGAGKSTLLKVVSKVLKPTSGRAVTRGTVAPILELGTGFDYELTGMENIELNALLLGRSRREVEEKKDEIIEFSGLSEFVHSPVRSYSSGMMARLGFSIATAWKPDLLILDEVLAVGDSRFIRRCEQRIEDLHSGGTTMLMVSHSANAIRTNCERAIWLEGGEIRARGDTEEVLQAYDDFAEDSSLGADTSAPRAGDAAQIVEAS